VRQGEFYDLSVPDGAHYAAHGLWHHNSGKSYAGAARAMVRRFGKQRPSLGLVVSPTYRMLRDATWRTALDVWAPLIARVVQNEHRVELATGDEVIFRSADDPEHLRGPNAGWAWLDEAALCHPGTWPIVIGRLRQHGVLGECFATTTPKGMNWVYDVWITGATDQTSVHRATTAQNPFIAQAFVSSLRSQYSGDFARQELEAEFIADLAGALIEWRWLDEARSKPAAYDPAAGPVHGGLDVAGPGEAESVLVLRQGDAILDLAAWLDPDPRGAVLAHLAPWRHRGLERVNVDTAGIGHYLARHLEDHGITVSDVNVGERPWSTDGAERCANLKAELFWSLRERFADGEISGLTDRTLVSQLAGLRYEHDPRGRVRIESKQDAVKRGLKSPDRAEALMLAFSPENPERLRASLYGLRSG